MTSRLRSLLVAGRPGHPGAEDIAAKLEAICAARSPRTCRVLRDPDPAVDDERRIELFDSIWRMSDADLSGVLLPSFESHRFAAELAPVCDAPILDMFDAVALHLASRHPRARRIGILAPASAGSRGLFEIRFAGLQRVYPRAAAPMHLQAVEHAFDDLVDQGAELVLTGITVLRAAMDRLRRKAAAAGLPLVDSNQVYAEFAAQEHHARPARPFKIGVVGGVGPAATVSFLDTLVRATPATRDQDHLRFVVEQNPQIPDRTEHLIGDGPDPTLALYATCRKLQQADADVIAIPCNTAHAFVKHIQPRLGIPIVHMLRETVEFITRTFPAVQRIGLLATSGTVASRVYHDEIESAILQATAPEPAVQQQIMDVIYGPRGVKAGFLDARCRAAVEEAIAHLARRGAEVVILGCTELPLLVAQDLDYRVDGRTIPVIDPADVLARRCIELGRAVTCPVPPGTRT